MLQAGSTERAAAARLWVPGMSPGPMDAGSARAQEIARRREEMLGMLHDLPESDYELSLTDLVEKVGGNGGDEEAAAPAPAPPSEGREQPAPGRPAGRPERRAVRTAAGQREQLPQQQRRRPAQLLHAAVAHPELHRAAAQPDAVHLRRPDTQRRLRVQQEGEGPGRRDRQVLVVAVGSAVAQVQPAGPGRAAQRVRYPRRVGRHPQSGQALHFTGQSLSLLLAFVLGHLPAALQACSLYICFVCDILIRFV